MGVARASCPGRSDGRKGHGEGLRRAHAPALRHGQDGHATTGYKQVGGQIACLFVTLSSCSDYVRRDPRTGDVILSRKPADWKAIFAALDGAQIPAEFMEEGDRDRSLPQKREIL